MPSEPKKILIIDDSPLSRMMIKAIVQSKFPQWQIVEADGAKAALEHTRQLQFDFITLDMNMPEVDGLTIAPQLQTDCPAAHIALFTGNLQERVVSKAKEQGLTFIPKPITEAKVLEFLGVS